jgi:hypothetical protein
MTGDSYKYWHVYPITVYAGENIVEVYGLTSNEFGSFGCEVYDNSIFNLVNANSLDDLNVLFTSKGKTNFDLVQSYNGEYLGNGFMCSTNFSYSSKNNNCQKINTCCNEPLITLSPTITNAVTSTPSMTLSASKRLPTLYGTSLNIISDTDNCNRWGTDPFATKKDACLEYSNCFNESSISLTVQINLAQYRMPLTPILGDTLYLSNGLLVKEGYYIVVDDISRKNSIILVDGNGMLMHSEYCVEPKLARGQNTDLCSYTLGLNILVYVSYNNSDNTKKLYRTELNGKMGISDWKGFHSFVLLDGNMLTVDYDGNVESLYIC